MLSIHIRCLRYIHIYPTARQSKLVLQCGKTTVHRRILPSLEYLAAILDEIHWGDRLNPWNHSEVFPLYVTGMLYATVAEIEKERDNSCSFELISHSFTIADGEHLHIHLQ